MKMATIENTIYKYLGIYPFQEMVINSKNKEVFEKLLLSKGFQFTTTPGGWWFEENSITYHYRCSNHAQSDIIWECITNGY